MSKILLAWPPRFACDIPEGPPLGLLYIAGILRQKHDVWVLDFEALKYNWGQIEQRLKDENPDILGLSCTTLTYENMKRLISLARRAIPDAKVMIGGPHVTSYPLRSLEYTGAECAVTGEAELVIEQVVDELIKNNKPGVVTGKRPEDLDSIPLPSIDLLEPNLTTYLGNMPRHISPESMMLWSRGCPFNCFFCSDSVYGHTKPRYRSPENIITEIKRLDRLGIKEIFVYDDDLVGVTKQHTKWLESVCNLIICERLNRINYKCQGRCSDNVTIDTLELMKKAGFKCIMWGCESGSDKVLRNIRKGITVNHIVSTIKLCKNANIEAWMFLMVGNYTETSQDAEKTINMVKRCKPDHVQVTYATPYPSDFENFCIKNNLIIEPDRSKWDTNIPVINPDSMSVDDMIKYRKKIVNAYTRKQLFDIQSYFGRDKYVFRKWRRFRYLWQQYGLGYAIRKALKKIQESI
jgi:anaerobic magnesium-protoporphyrin IX monomethyl ester cyclase